MSRFVDDSATTRVELGPCECPGSPHGEGDYARVRSQLSAHEIARWSMSSGEELGAETAALVAEWNLLGPKGEAMPVTAEAILALMTPTLSAIVEHISHAIRDSASPPNRSGAPSASGSSGSASPSLVRA